MNTLDLSFYSTSKYKLTLCLSMALFFSLFMLFFLPFGVSNYDPNHHYTADFLFFIGLISGIMFVVSLFNEFLLRPFILRRINFQRIVIWSLWTLILLSSVNFMTYNAIGDWHDFHLKSWLEFILNCSTVLVFPLVGTFFFFRYKSLQRQFHHVLTNVAARVDATQLITFEGQGNNDRIVLSVSTFQYARAQDNYVELYYLEGEKMAKFLIRASLSSLSKSISILAIARCHRSYMVNLYHVKSAKGGNSDLRLYLDPFDTEIPVSRSYRDAIMNDLKAVKSFG